MAANDNADTFVFYPTFLTSIEAIKNAAMRLAMFEAVANYGVYGTLPDFTDADPNGLLDGMFLQMRFSIDEAKAKRSTNRENGSRGGAPKGNKNACKNNRKQPNSTENKLNNPNVNVNDNVNANVISSNEDKAKSVSRFVAPTLDEIQEYCKEKGFNLDAAAIYDHYTANGWVQGKNKPIKDWKAAVRQWARREGEFVKPQPQINNDARRGIDDVSHNSGDDYEGMF